MYINHKEGPKPKVYEWPDEDEDTELPYDENIVPPPTEDPGEAIRINFIYKKKDG